MSADLDVEEDHYATAANFGGDAQDSEKAPFVTKVTVPESIKRRVPSKHYVYKVVIEWSNDSTVIIYRRYTHFFDFLVKLQQLVSSLVQKKVIEGPVNLPELPGRVLFGRREVHQVAEKRRRKIEEFCQQLIQLPPEISQSSLVLGFFNTWPDDTLLRSNPSAQPVISKPVLTSPPPKHLSSQSPPLEQSKEESPPPGPFSSVDVPPLSPLIISPSMMASSAFSKKSHIEQAIESIISHPDEMENLEQYRVLDNYERKDSHQVSLHAGQIVHVIEKHDTGWWMVMSDDEQGYAPAVYLEPVEESNTDKDVYPESNTDEVYEAMESFSAENEDEVGFKAGERIHVINKSMDGWWKIRCNGKVGYSPAALIRRKMTSSSQLTSSLGNFESEKFIYEEMNIHRPPPRRNTIDRTALSRVKGVSGIKPPHGYDSPKSNVALASHFDSDVYVNPAEEIYTNPADDDDIYAVPPEDDGEELYAIPPELSDEEDNQHYKVPKTALTSYKMNGEAHQGASQKAGSERHGSSEVSKAAGDKPVPMRRSPEKQVSFTSSGEVSKTITAGVKTTGVATSVNGSTSSLPRKGSLPEDKATAQQSADASAATKPKKSIYDDTVFDTETLKRQDKASSGGGDGDDVDEPDAVYENTNFDQDPVAATVVSIPLKKPPISKISQASKRHKPKKHTPDDYEDLEHFEGKSPTELIPALDDYVDMDGTEHNMYVVKEELQPANSPSNPLSPLTSAVPQPQGGSKPTLSKSVSMEVEGQQPQATAPIMEDEYIEMDSVVPDPTDKTEPTTPSHASSVKSSKPLRPSPPQKKKAPGKSQSTQNVLSKILKKSPLIRAKSMEDILSLSSKDDYAEIPQQHSPQMEHKTFQPTPPPLPPPRVPGGNKRQSGIVERYTETTPPKTKAAQKAKSVYSKFGRTPKPSLVNGHPPSSSRRSASPPSTQSPTVASPDSATSPLKSGKGQDTPTDSQGKRENILSRMIERMQTKYIALHSYSSSKDGCLTFSAGELCTVKQKKNDGWWLVRIGDREGWTPGNYWKEESKSNGPTTTQTTTSSSTSPQKASEVRKPRSHTVATDSPTSPPSSTVTSSSESATGASEAETVRSSSLSVSPDGGDRTQISSSMDGSKPLLPSRPPLLTKPKLLKGPPPPRPKPFVPASTNQGPNVKKPMKPVPPQKPSATKLAAVANRSSPGPSTPPERRKKSVSPPPLPPPNQTRKFSSPTDVQITDDEYVMLKDAICMQDIKSAPWFSGKMDRMQAEQFLMEHGRQREFLVRERTAKDGFYALSIRYHYSCKHFNIDPTGDGQFSMGTLTFASIEEVIHHYQQNSLFIHDGHHVTLGQPAKKRTRGSDASKYNPSH